MGREMLVRGGRRQRLSRGEERRKEGKIANGLGVIIDRRL